jgi:glycine/D-amino acid oxidase-like deaminating enzyme
MNASNHQTELLIIGGGVIGVCAAYYLTEQGRSATLVEKSDKPTPEFYAHFRGERL